jgi:hypothetical protein
LGRDIGLDIGELKTQMRFHVDKTLLLMPTSAKNPNSHVYEVRNGRRSLTALSNRAGYSERTLNQRMSLSFVETLLSGSQLK